MAWKKSPPELVSAFERIVPDRREVERRKMFGYPAAFVNGNMFVGLHEDRLVLRLDDETAGEAKRHGATDFEPMPGRAMKGWVAVPHERLDESRARAWIERALSHVSDMPGKGRKPKRVTRAAGSGRRS
jgi:TfoX/Sxy family transcriptional regulator of competence genes